MPESVGLRISTNAAANKMVKKIMFAKSGLGISAESMYPS
mgnify:CR=1 FL=1